MIKFKDLNAEDKKAIDNYELSKDQIAFIFKTVDDMLVQQAEGFNYLKNNKPTEDCLEAFLSEDGSFNKATFKEQLFRREECLELPSGKAVTFYV